MEWKTLDEMDLMGKRVLTRVDINVPTENGIVSDTTRIERIVPRCRHCLKLVAPYIDCAFWTSQREAGA